MTRCKQCGIALNPVQVMLGPVCGDCCRANHSAVATGRPDLAPYVQSTRFALTWNDVAARDAQGRPYPKVGD